MPKATVPFARPPVPKLGLIAGRGDLPALLIQAAQDQQREVFVLAIQGDANPAILHPTEQGEAQSGGGLGADAPIQKKTLSHRWIAIADLADTLDIFRAEGVTEVVMAGGISRPPLKAFKPTAQTARILGKLGKAFFGGDDTLFTAIVQVFEEEGFRIIGAEELLVDLLTPAGLLTQAKPAKEASEDIARGIPLLQEIGKLDIGQALIIRNGQVLGVEALEGTDALIQRCGNLTEQGEAQSGGGLGVRHPFKDYRGILIKARKPGQEQRVDMPTIGPDTIRNLYQAGFSGMAVEAGGSLMIRKAETITLANEYGLFIEGFKL